MKKLWQDNAWEEYLYWQTKLKSYNVDLTMVINNIQIHMIKERKWNAYFLCLNT